MEPQICRGLPETGPRGPDWRPEAPPAAAPAKDSRAARWCHRSWGAHWLALPGPRATTCWLQLAEASPAAPIHSSHPPTLSRARRGGTDSVPLLAAKKSLTSVPTHCQVAKNEPLVHPSSRDLPAYFLVPSRPHRARSTQPGPPACLPGPGLPGKVTRLSRAGTQAAGPRLR